MTFLALVQSNPVQCEMNDLGFALKNQPDLTLPRLIRNWLQVEMQPFPNKVYLYLQLRLTGDQQKALATSRTNHH